MTWSPGNDQRIQVRAGVGIYHEPLLAYTVENLRRTLPFYKYALRPNFSALATFPDAVAAARGDAGQLRIFDYHNPKNPVIYRYNLSLQRQLTPRWTAEISYVGARGNHLLRTFEANLNPFAVRQPDGKLFLPPDPDWVKPDGNIYSSNDPNRPSTPPDNVMNPAFGSIQRTLTDAQSFYNSGFVSINGGFGRAFTLGANYTYSKSVDDASSVLGLQEHYGLDRKMNRGLSTFDRRHIFTLRYFYSPPLGSGQRWLNAGWLSTLFGGWRLGGILSMRSGSAFGIAHGIPETGFVFVSQRPNLAPGYSGDPTSGVTAGCTHPLTGQTQVAPGLTLGGPDLYFDPCAFQPPKPGYIGDAGRTTLTGPGSVNLDFSLQKEFSIDSERNLQFRAEFFNLSNHANFQAPDGPALAIFRDGGIVNSSAGKIRSTATNPRQIQFALRLSF
ncbi:MAG: hypothetical protein A3F68_05600 [Acidobacteria bacterium RIFCSPLOWO2_12_FULL_54_10]|nr:MAG: hypothetical protein A3F68_05600 [Acidobacteria bacterium RIFCSPLOWO2_12_FULL_54_10]